MNASLRRPAAQRLLLFGLVALAFASCAKRPPPIPAGITILEPEVPTPSEALVEEAQRRLRSRGLYDGFVDGVLGARTRIALIRLQREAGLDETGLLDWPTATALGLDLEGERPEELQAPPPPQGLEPLPGAIELLQGEEGPPPPQPAAGALDEVRREALVLLTEAGQAAEEAIEEGRRSLETGAGPGAGERALREAQARLAEARGEAFRLIIEARRAGGFALLPPSMIEALEEELVRRSLLLSKPNGRLDEEDEAAIRWMERTLGLPLSGEPSAALFDALGLDISPLFEG